MPRFFRARGAAGAQASEFPPSTAATGEEFRPQAWQPLTPTALRRPQRRPAEGLSLQGALGARERLHGARRFYKVVGSAFIWGGRSPLMEARGC